MLRAIPVMQIDIQNRHTIIFCTQLLCGNCARHSRAMHRAELFEVDFLDPDQQKAQGKA